MGVKIYAFNTFNIVFWYTISMVFTLHVALSVDWQIKKRSKTKIHKEILSFFFKVVNEDKLIFYTPIMFVFLIEIKYKKFFTLGYSFISWFFYYKLLLTYVVFILFCVLYSLTKEIYFYNRYIINKNFLNKIIVLIYVGIFYFLSTIYIYYFITINFYDIDDYLDF